MDRLRPTLLPVVSPALLAVSALLWLGPLWLSDRHGVDIGAAPRPERASAPSAPQTSDGPRHGSPPASLPRRATARSVAAADREVQPAQALSPWPRAGGGLPLPRPAALARAQPRPQSGAYPLIRPPAEPPALLEFGGGTAQPLAVASPWPRPAAPPAAPSADEAEGGRGSRQVAGEVSPERPPRSRALERIAEEADRRTAEGFALAGRGAFFSARAEFIAALRILAQGLDAEYATAAHSRALTAGLTALREAEDFVPRGAALETDIDVAAIATGHESALLDPDELARTNSLKAADRYLTYAQERLAAAGGGEVAASMALRGLGKLHADEQALGGAAALVAAQSKGMAYFQAALMVSPQNHMAANDLGVLLARVGRSDEARAVLEHALRIAAQPTTAHNLVTVYARLGEHDLARRLAARMPDAPAVDAAALVQWVPPDAMETGARPSPVAPRAPLVTARDGSDLPTRNPPPAAPFFRTPSAVALNPWDLLRQRN